MADPRDAELRFNVSTETMTLIDALMQAKSCGSRADLLIPVIEAFIQKEIHEATVLLRIARINPLVPDRNSIHPPA